MLRHIRSIVIIALAAGLMWNCGGERVTQSEVGTDEQVARPLSKLAVAHHKAQAVVMVTLHSDGTPISGATVEFSRSIAGQAPDYQWSGTTDEKGQTLVEIASGNGYYQARASQDGVEIGSWSSIPINSGYEVMLNLPIGGQAQVKGSYSLEPTKQITARDVVNKKTLKAFVEAAKEYAKSFPLSEDIEAEFRQEGGKWKHESIYLVLGNSDGVILFHAANSALEGQNLIHLEDPNGVKYTQELIAAAAAGGGFVAYYFDNPAVDENGDGELVGDPVGSPKIGYALPVIDAVTGMELALISGFYPPSATVSIGEAVQIRSLLGTNVNAITGKSVDDVLAAYTATYGESPNTPYWAHAYDATTLLLNAIKTVAGEAGGKLYVDRTALRGELHATSGFQALLGTLNCDEFGDCGTGRINIYHHTDTSITDPAQLPVVYRFAP